MEGVWVGLKFWFVTCLVIDTYYIYFRASNALGEMRGLKNCPIKRITLLNIYLFSSRFN